MGGMPPPPPPLFAAVFLGLRGGNGRGRGGRFRVPRPSVGRYYRPGAAKLSGNQKAAAKVLFALLRSLPLLQGEAALHCLAWNAMSTPNKRNPPKTCRLNLV